MKGNTTRKFSGSLRTRCAVHSTKLPSSSNSSSEGVTATTLHNQPLSGSCTPASSSGVLRRSSRVPSFTPRAQEYMQQQRYFKANHGFPHNGDIIAVRWKLGEREVWWPGEVTKINSASPSSSTAQRGELRYRPFGDYGAEEMCVRFFFLQSSQSRLVSHDERSDHDNCEEGDLNLCSWVFLHELTSADRIPDSLLTASNNNSTVHAAPSNILHTPSRRNRSAKSTPSHSRGQHGGPSLAITKIGSARNKRPPTSEATPQLRSHSDPGPPSLANNNNTVTAEDPPIRPQAQVILSATDATDRQRTDKDIEVRTDMGNPITPNPILAQLQPDISEVQTNHLQALSIPPSVNLRLELLERKMEDVGKTSTSSLSSSAQSVVVTLKWAILRQLEKPLKDMKLPELSELGIAQSNFQVSVQCDYFTFRELASALAQCHIILDESQCTGRIAFSPSFDIIQSGSVASDNLTIIFSTLADVTAFLRIRDEQDYETMLSKEFIAEDRSFFRLLGTFRVEDSTENITSRQQRADHDVRESICVESNDITVKSNSIRIYVASAPIDFLSDEPDGSEHNRSNTNYEDFRTVLLEQKCAHFSRVSSSFQTNWRAKSVSSDLKVSCTFDLDGIARPGQLGKYFTLSWSRLQQPSAKKWTRDVHNIGNNSPGSLTMTLPSIFTSTHKNVTALSTIMDENIETIMALRSKLHRLSSV